MRPIRLSVGARTDVGRVRKSNEDSFVVSDLEAGTRVDDPNSAVEMTVGERGVLMVVSDGMGGHAAGEVASAMVVNSLPELMAAADDSVPVEVSLELAVHQANSEVFEAAQGSSKEGMGATLTAVLVHQYTAYVAEVGDSRAYVWRQGRLRQLTRDQSYVQMLLDAGTITSEQAASFANKNWIVQAMGLEPDVQASLGKLDLRNDDRLMVCCDGLYGLVDDEELAEVLADDDPSAACNRLVDLANERGGTDNVTVIVAKISAEGLVAQNADESVTQTFKVLKEYCGQGAEARTKPTLTSPPSRPGVSTSSPPVAIPATPPLPVFDDDRVDATALAGSSPPVAPIPSEPAPAASSGAGRLSIVVMGLVLLFTAAGYWFVLAN